MAIDYSQLVVQIKQWGRELGFQQVGIADLDLSNAQADLKAWLDKGYHGEMAYMQQHAALRGQPEALVPGTLRIISVRMDYLPPDPKIAKVLAQADKAFISRYALGRDYHKLIRKRLQQLADKINQEVEDFAYRAFTDSAPVMEKPLAEKAGLGWIGKNTLLLNRQAGSWFFLGELFTNLPLPVDAPVNDHCGKCRACITACPTGAIVAPYQLDARRCISYLTIELKSAIPLELRKLIGNRIYGCDDCQLVCPWNRFAKAATELAFHPRYGLEEVDLVSVFAWDESEFLQKTEGSAIRRIGYLRWLRNVAVALGNAPATQGVLAALTARRDHPSPLVREHVLWAIQEQGEKLSAKNEQNKSS